MNNTHYLVEIPAGKEQEFLNAVTLLDPQARTPDEVVLGDCSRTARLQDVESFYTNTLYPQFSQFLAWEELSPETQRGIAHIMADNRDYQFADVYSVDDDEIYHLIGDSYPEVLNPQQEPAA